MEREIAALRAENKRLTRLLDLRGQDIRPDSEQLTAPLRPPGLVTRHSESADKIALFMDLFRARRDGHAVRWENERLGTKGWTPAAVGGWRKGMRWATASRIPLTEQVVRDHLEGKKFIGLYPMFVDNTCAFLAADFDGATAMLDALAYVKVATSFSVPTALEISQSGRGAHVWIFFTGPVPAATARQMGTVLIHGAAVMRGSMDLRSYDRLFPSQDVLPGEGPGNLIAAPLYGKRRRDGLTEFLDVATLEPFDDQWAYLSMLRRATPREVGKIAARVKDVATGSEVRRLTRSAATKVHPRLPSRIFATLGAGLAIDTAELSPAALATFKHAASMANPRFYELQRLRKSVWGVPRFIQGYDLTLGGEFVVPRGLRHAIASMVETAGSRLDITDGRNTGSEVDLTFGGSLSPAQDNAVGALLAHDDGVLVAAPGSGKTVMACAIIAERATSTLVLVDRKALADQWRERVFQFLGVKAGQLGAGRSRLTGAVDIMMLPTLARRDDIVELTAPYGQVVVDEAHHVAAAVYDHTVKRIAARFWLGLTATPRRRDGLGELVTWQLGPVRHVLDERDRGTLLDPQAAGVAERRLVVHETGFTADDIDIGEPGALADLYHRLALDRNRNAQIVDDVAAAVSDGRNCLVLTRRIAHLAALDELLHARALSALRLQGGMPAKERRAVIDRLAAATIGEGALVIGTMPFIGEGFDSPALDTLFLAAPISYDGLLVQCVGRILREASGKSTAVVHDYHDAMVPVLAASLGKRMPGYRALRFDSVVDR